MKLGSAVNLGLSVLFPPQDLALRSLYDRDCVETVYQDFAYARAMPCLCAHARTGVQQARSVVRT